MKIALRGLLFPCLACLLLGACAAGKTSAGLRSGQPSFRSVYYYVLGTYFQSGGKYLEADVLLRRAAAADPSSQSLNRQVLLNSLDLWQNGLLEAGDLRKEIAAYQGKYRLDEELLYAVCDFHEEGKDFAAARALLDELQARHPSARADIRGFVHGLRVDGEARLELLEAAREKAENDPATLKLLAGIWSNFDPLKEKEALLRGHELDPDEESFAYLADYAVRHQDRDLARRYLAGLRYPEERERLLYLTGSPWVPERNPLLVDLAEPLLETGDPDILNSLAYAALMEKRPDILATIASRLDSLPAPARDKQDMGAILVADALLRNSRPRPDWLDRLGESACFNDIPVYYFSGLRSKSIESWDWVEPAAWAAFQERVRENLPQGPASAYLAAFAKTARDSSYTGITEAKKELVLHLRERFILSEDDYSFLLGYHIQTSQEETYLSILKEALDRYPDNPAYCNDLGYRMLIGGGDLEEAARLIRHALVFEPDNIFYLDSLAWYHYLTGDHDEALLLMARPQKQSELPAEIAWHIGAIYLALEDYPSARSWLERCLEIGNDPASEQEAREALEKLP